MTHEELLAKINAAGAYALQADSYGWIALRAIVELHKSKSIAISAGTNEPFRYQEVCDLCIKPYPCETIQAIEKELGGN